MLNKFRRVSVGIRSHSQSLYQRLHLKYLIPFVILLVYTVIGAVVFYWVENHNDTTQRTKYKKAYDFAREQVMKRLVEIRWDPELNNSVLIYNRTLDAFTWYHETLGINEFLDEKLGPSPWTWWNSMFYAGTIYTTIGYGRPAAVTHYGQMFTCLYALIGIPLFLTILKEVGKHLSRVLRRLWKHMDRALRRMPKIRCHWRLGGSWRRLKEPSPFSISDEKHSSTTSVAEHPKRRPFPVSLSLLLLVLWIFVCAGIFCIWETEWSYYTSVYFIFISLSTIGLGDIVPTKPDLMLANFILILIGLALISMCFNIIQIRIEEMLDEMLQQFMDEFEKIATAADDTEGFEIGISGPLAAMPLQKIGAKKDKVKEAKKWFTNRLVNALGPSRGNARRGGIAMPRRRSSSSEEELDLRPIRGPELQAKTSVVGEAMQRWASDQSGNNLRRSLLAKMMDNSRLEALENRIRQKICVRSVAVQTENDFSELLEFLKIPKQDLNATASEPNGSIGSLSDAISFWTAKSEFSYLSALEGLSIHDSHGIFAPLAEPESPGYDLNIGPHGVFHHPDGQRPESPTSFDDSDTATLMQTSIYSLDAGLDAKDNEPLIPSETVAEARSAINVSFAPDSLPPETGGSSRNDAINSFRSLLNEAKSSSATATDSCAVLIEPELASADNNGL